jgi:hypothetical protein
MSLNILQMRSHRLLKLQTLKAMIFTIYGIVHSQSLEYARIARHVPTDTSHHHTKKRIYRFMNNKDIDMGLLMVVWCKFIVGLLYSLAEYVPVMVDITWVNGEKYIKAAIPFFSRGIPIGFLRFTDEDVRKMTKGMSQNDIEEAFFTWIRLTLWDYKVVVIADRGFRRASLLAFLRELGLHYVIRLCGNVWISTRKGAKNQYSGILGNISLRVGERKYMRDISLQQSLMVLTHLVLGKVKAEKGKKIEPWYIATDFDDLDKAYGYYEKRMWIEEMFRDLKSRFQWCGYRAESPEAREMLTFCLMVSYTIVLFLGYQVSRTNRQALVASYGKSSITWLGIGFLNHKKASASALFCQVRRRLGLVADKIAA